MILDIIQIIELAVIIYLLWQFIPTEKQNEEIRNFKKKLNIKPKAKIIEWTPPEEPELKVQKKIIKDLKNG
jgi:hypothetical protein